MAGADSGGNVLGRSPDEELLVAIVEGGPFALFRVDAGARIVSARGRAAPVLWGGAPGAVVGKTLCEVGHGRAWLVEGARRALAGEEAVVAGESGGRWFDAYLQPARGAAGAPVGAVGLAVDVSDRSGSAEIERTVSLLKATLEATADGIFTVDVRQRVGFINQKFLDMWRLSEEVMRLPDFSARMAHIFDQLVDPEGYHRRAQGYYAHPEQASWDVLEFKDGRIYERYSQPQWVRGECVGRVISFRDVTERRRAERERDRLLVEERTLREAAEAAERRAALLASLGPKLAESLDYEGRLGDAARAVVPAVADGAIVYALDERGRPRCIETVHGDEGTRRAAAALAQCYCDGRAGELGGPLGRVFTAHQPLLVEEVSPRWIYDEAADDVHRQRLRAVGFRSIVALPLLARGKAIGVLVLFTTADERRFGADELAFAREIAGRIAVFADNARLYREAERAVGVRDEFLSVASHELRTPLTSLKLAVQSLLLLVGEGALAELPPATAQMMTQIMQRIERQSRRLGTLVGTLLDVSRISTGLLTPERAEVDLGEVAGDVVALLRDDSARAGSPVALRAERVVGRWDRGRIEQLLINLVSNALRYGAGKPIEIEVAADGDAAVLRVVDHGEGIAPELKARIFDKFERGGSSRHHGGLGLGLYIARCIVEAHGGTIGVESTPGQGAAFTARLPR